MIVEHLPSEMYRYERKFLLDGMDLAQIDSLIKTHPSFFREIYPERCNNNIYFDTPGYDFYRHNVEGISERVKVRIRWYGDLFGKIEKPVLEFKIKSGLVGRKPSFVLQPFEFYPGISPYKLSDLLQDQAVPEGVRVDLRALRPALINRYHRRYYMSADQRFRLTLDFLPEFYSVPDFESQLPKHKILRERIILEVKFIQTDERFVEMVSNHFPFRMTKSSKYVDGIDLLDDVTLNG